MTNIFKAFIVTYLAACDVKYLIVSILLESKPDKLFQIIP